jgi:hypothetical protein
VLLHPGLRSSGQGLGSTRLRHYKAVIPLVWWACKYSLGFP